MLILAKVYQQSCKHMNFLLQGSKLVVLQKSDTYYIRFCFEIDQFTKKEGGAAHLNGSYNYLYEHERFLL